LSHRSTKIYADGIPARPWLHWHTDNHNFVGNFTVRDRNRFQTAPYFTDQATGLIFSNVMSAESMEPIVEKGVSKWYNTRKILDFFDSQHRLRSQPSNVRRWMAHLLLTTTVNITVAQTIQQKWFAPANHFYDQEMLSQYSKTNLLVSCLLAFVLCECLPRLRKILRFQSSSLTETTISKHLRVLGCA
jgi:hypothetical protein